MSHGLKRGVFESLGLHGKSGKSCGGKAEVQKGEQDERRGLGGVHECETAVPLGGWGRGAGRVRVFVKRSLFPRGGGG